MKNICQLAAFKTKITQLPEKDAAAILALLPESEGAAMNALPPFDPEMIESIPVYGFIGKIHVSWLTPFFQTLSHNDQMLFIAAFAHRKEELIKALNIEVRDVQISQMGKFFILQKIYSHFLANPDLLPFPFLSNDPLFPLFLLEKADFLDYIDLLGLYDVALEVPSLIYTYQLKAIDQLLSGTKAAYLKKIQSSPSEIRFEKIGLSLWDGDPIAFKKMLFQRGLHRLCIGTSRSNASFIHHLTLVFSKEEAKNFQTLYKKKRKDSIIDKVKEELISTLSYLNQHTRQP